MDASFTGAVFSDPAHVKKMLAYGPDDRRTVGLRPHSEDAMNDARRVVSKHAKYKTSNPISRYLVRGFQKAVEEIVVPLGARSVLGRNTSCRSSNEEPVQLETVGAAGRGGLAGETETPQSRVKKTPAPVPGEHPPGTVAPMRRRSKAHHKKTGFWIPKGGHRLSPVDLARVTTGSHLLDVLSMPHQARTEPAGDHPPLD